MEYLGIPYEMKHAPKLDPTFIPFGVWRAAYLDGAKQPISIALERDQGQISVHHTFIHGTPEMAEADYRYVERYVKFLLWSTGGFRVSICGCSELAQKLKAAYQPDGERAFDFTFVNQLYERDLEILDLPYDACPPPTRPPSPSAATWTAAASALTPAAPTARSLPSSTASASTPRRSSGSPSSTRIPTIISATSSRP